MRQIRVRFEFDRGRAEGTGITQYRWRSVGDEDVGKVRWSQNVQRFPLRGADNFDHPGFTLCT